MLCALVQENIVVEIVELTDEEIFRIGNQYSAIIDCDGITPVPQIGDEFDGNHIVGTTPSIKITKLALRNRFTFNEKIALQTALASSVALQAWFEDFRVATYIDLARADTIAGINYLQSAGLIGSGRANEILNTPPTTAEKYIKGT